MKNELLTLRIDDDPEVVRADRRVMELMTEAAESQRTLDQAAAAVVELEAAQEDALVAGLEHSVKPLTEARKRLAAVRSDAEIMARALARAKSIAKDVRARVTGEIAAEFRTSRQGILDRLVPLLFEAAELNQELVMLSELERLAQCGAASSPVYWSVMVGEAGRCQLAFWLALLASQGYAVPVMDASLVLPTPPPRITGPTMAGFSNAAGPGGPVSIRVRPGGGSIQPGSEPGGRGVLADGAVFATAVLASVGAWFRWS